MKIHHLDVLVVGAGPVGLMCAYLGKLCGLNIMAIDKSSGPLRVGRADALNARTLQLLELAHLFDELYPLGKPCNTSSIWANGKFQCRRSSWWEELQGCAHKHFLMLGQSHVESLLDSKLTQAKAGVLRQTTVSDIKILADGCQTDLSNGDTVFSKYIVGADGSRSFVRNHFNIPFEIERPQIVWAVIDGIIESDFPKVPEIIAFQADTADVAWIPREGDIDRFYIRMDKKDFTLAQVMQKINRAMQPHTIRFKKIVWSSQFSVKESVAESFSKDRRIFLAGDACHIHSVNGGQGLNTGLADAFNLMWKLHEVIKHGKPKQLLNSYESERKPVAESVIASSGELVRSTKFSKTDTHAEDYVKIVEKRSGNITGMGIRYGNDGLRGTRLHDFSVFSNDQRKRIYNFLDYSKYTLLVFSEKNIEIAWPNNTNMIRIGTNKNPIGLCADEHPYKDLAMIIRPDSYIAYAGSVSDIATLRKEIELIR